MPRIGASGSVSWSKALEFLRRRKGLFDGVVFSGGEPTAQPGLIQAIRGVREEGFQVGLHTGGAYPTRLAEVISHVDWVGMDFKARFVDYDQVTAVKGSGEKARASARILIDSGLPSEFRTTLHPRYHSSETILEGAEELAELGARTYWIQEFRRVSCADPTLLDPQSGNRGKLDVGTRTRLKELFLHFGVREV
jgi:pyruvate formate lyase activating enzyme